MENGYINGYASSSSSSPPTPPSPLPVSLGPGNRKYSFSPSPSPSPPFSSSDDIPLVHQMLAEEYSMLPFAFSLDRPHDPTHDELDSKSSCLKDLLLWFLQRCSSCFSPKNSGSPDFHHQIPQYANGV